MKYIILFCLISCPAIAFGQLINPAIIAQDTDIALHNTDVYYCPFGPPAPYDTRAGLCNMANKILDSNGIFEGTYYMQPITHNTPLYSWAPCGTLIGHVPWQRLFTAKRKPDGTPSDIVAGGNPGDRVTISKNEDVDFRASGRIKLKSGFHVKPGAFFHAYTEPRWGSTVFTDDFNGATIDTNQWYVANGSNAESGGIQCVYDTDVQIVNDPAAIDGKALDIMLREDTTPCDSCRNLTEYWMDTCYGTFSTSDTIPHTSVFSSALVRACPWPMANRTTSPPDSMAYQHMPFGKYEIREKIPHILHHENNWLYGSFEVDMNEEGQDDTTTLRPSVHYNVHLGPFQGIFKKPGGNVIFVSPDAHWSLANSPDFIFINNFAYDVMLKPGHKKDTVIGTNGGIGGTRNWPVSLSSDTTDSVTFYYAQTGVDTADNLTWTAKIDPYDPGHYRVISAPYHVIAPTDTQWFSKSYQPYQITLTYDFDGHKKTFACRWDSAINHYYGDTNLLLLTDDSLLTTGNRHTYTEPYAYWIDNGLFDYQGPYIPFEWGNQDTASYKYHTITTEILPNEIRILYDSNVVFRVPDRMIPPGNPQYDLVKNMDRTPLNFYIGELDMDPQASNPYDPFGTNDTTYSWGAYVSRTYRWRKDFEHAVQNQPWAGIWPYKGTPAAHTLIDYVRVWDVPADVSVPNFPQ